jgi:acyl-CoA synthetase (AMP-forming)/AMP-acid ligase II/acyl carrier protein
VSLVKGIDYVTLNSSDVLLSTGSFSFDATTLEYWGMLLNGGQLIVCNESRLLNSKLLKQEIKQHGVTKMWFTSSWFNQLVETDIDLFEGLHTILVGGEKLSEQHIKQVNLAHPSLTIINGYGPTENTTFSLTFNITDSGNRNSIPIGRPLNNRYAFILDTSHNPAPIGVAGEIYLGGAGLSRGYLNQPELTAEKFLSNPFSPLKGDRLYKTGDLGRWLEDGNIEYLGRLDDQVKIRGFRIELGEIENVLQQNDMVRHAVVMVKEDKERNKRLVAYIVPEGLFDRDSVQAWSKSKLPEYMVPSFWVLLESLPLTPNGKVDKKALPDPDANFLVTRKYVAPRNELERKLVEMWQDLLKVDRVGIEDNFFELGGHSLLAMRMISYIERDLLLSIPIQVLFKFTSISDLSKYLDIQAGANSEEKNTNYQVVDI